MVNYVIILAICCKKLKKSQIVKFNFGRQADFYNARYLIVGIKKQLGYLVQYTLLAHSTFNLQRKQYLLKKMGV